MRVAWISYDFGEYSIRHANALAEAGVEVELMLARSTAGTYSDQISASVNTWLFDRPRFRQPLKSAKLIRQIFSRLETTNPTVVHFQGGHLWFNLAFKRLRSHPLVITCHNVRHHLGDRASQRTPQWIMDLGYKAADRLVVHGHDLRKQCVELLDFPEEAIDVIPHISMGSTADTQHIKPTENTVLFFGRIWEYKGLEYLIKAEPLVAAEIPDVRFVIAGQGEDITRYTRMFTSPDRYHVHNERVSDAEREAYFATAAVVAIPYVAATQSGVIPIAYQHAKPVVATTVGCLPEVVEDGKTGLLVSPRDERALADALIKLLRDKGLREALGQAGKAKLESESSPEYVAQCHIATYEKAIAQKQTISAT